MSDHFFLRSFVYTLRWQYHSCVPMTIDTAGRAKERLFSVTLRTTKWSSTADSACCHVSSLSTHARILRSSPQKMHHALFSTEQQKPLDNSHASHGNCLLQMSCWKSTVFLSLALLGVTLSSTGTLPNELAPPWILKSSTSILRIPSFCMFIGFLKIQWLTRL